MNVLHRRLVRRLRALAHERGISLTLLVDRAAISKSHLFRVLRGENSPSLDWITNVARVLEVDPGDLVAPPRRATRATVRRS